MWTKGATVAMVLIMRVSSAQNGPAADAYCAMSVLDDPANGDRWVLERNSKHPGGPGRLVRMEGESAGKREDASTRPVVVIRAGDRVMVEESTAAVEARLEGMALSSAASGGAVMVRLRVGGRMVEAVAVRPGHVKLAGKVRK